MVQRMLLPGGPNATDLSPECGVHKATLSRWLREAASVKPVSNHNTPGAASWPRRPEDWTAQERLRVVTEAGKLSSEDLGEFLRREGLHEETLEEWSSAALDALSPTPPATTRGGDKKRIKQLEAELRRKDKALAETAALIVLQKKVRAIWGDGDADTSDDNEK
jgi:transposase